MGVDGMWFNAPATKARISGLLARLDLPPGGRVVDIGCGRGEMLFMLAESFGAIGTGIDPDEVEIAVARRRQPIRGEINWRCAKVADVEIESNLDAAICVGATHAFGPVGATLRNAAREMQGFIREGGRLLIGEGYWKQPPAAEYLNATGLDAGEMQSHDANIATLEATGLRLVHAEQCSPDEWDAFETGFLRAAEKRWAESPDDKEAIAKLKHWRNWNDAFRRWGCTTMGFGFYVCEK